jgi:hypothetical protein
MRSLGFSPIAPLEGGTVKMATPRCSTKAVGGPSIGRRFQVRGGEIGANVSVDDNGGALIVSFIGP